MSQLSEGQNWVGDRELRSRMICSRRLRVLALWFGFLSSAGLGYAQEQEDESDPFAGVEVMVVLGNSSAALLTPQSTSVIAFDSESLEAHGIEDVSDIAAFVPNLEIRSQNATNASFFIRGVGLQDFGANASSAVPILQDGIVRNPSATQLTGLYDIAGLSVLRGPQGSGNYRNASAGVIAIQTVKPEFDFSTSARITLASIATDKAKNAARYKLEAAFTVPIIEDILSVRFSSRYSRENPFFENGCANNIPFSARTPAGHRNDASAQICDSITELDGQGRVVGVDGEGLITGQISQVTPFLAKYIGEVDDYGLRAQIRLQPPDTRLDLIVRFEISNLKRDSTVGQHLGTGQLLLGDQDGSGYRDGDIERRVIALEALGLSRIEVRTIIDRELFDRPFDAQPYRGDFDSPGRTKVKTLTASIMANVEHDLFATEVNIGFLNYRKSQDQDTDLSPNRLFPSTSKDRAWEIYGDIAFSGETIGKMPVQWGAGAYTLIEQVDANLDQSLPIGFGRNNVFEQEIYSFGIYVNAEYEFLEGFTFSAGARYNWETKDFAVQDTLVGGLFPIPPDESSNQETWDAVTGFAEVRYDFTEEIGLYFKYSRGFKAGHFNPSRAESAKIRGEGFADPEQIDAFEWGLDFAGWDNRVSGNAALFYYDYKNYQVFRLTNTPRGIFRLIENAKSARVFGAELEITILPLRDIAPEGFDQLSLNFRGGWLETEYLEFTNVEARTLAGFATSVTIDNTGNPLISAPNLQASLTATWPFEIGRLGMLTPQYDLAWTDDVPFDPNRGRGQINGRGESIFKRYQIGNRAYVLHNIRLSYDPPGDTGTRVSGWCRNLTDQRYATFSVDLTTFAGLQLHYLGDARTCGIDMRVSW